MTLNQPVLYIGLGGTGCAIGAELERRLRDELCGPDGAALLRERTNVGLVPYQLPSCLQFVYADFNQSELDKLPQLAVPGGEHIAAAQQTAHYVRDLVPVATTYPELAANLRVAATPFVKTWLPPADGEPKLAQLRKGAGQYPTVGRAALFDALRHGGDSAVVELRTAIGKLSNSGSDLNALGGGRLQTVDVFIAFSVAGGTGAGIFFDYVHLVGEQLRASGLEAKIYPLVVLPSAFPLGQGGGRPAQLNAGRALLDLFRLVDQQNAGDVDRDLRGFDAEATHRPSGADYLYVQYPGRPPVVLPPSTMQTAFLFSLPSGSDRDDLHRSIVSLVFSLVGAGGMDGVSHDGLHQSFAANFINHGADREPPAANGIGNRGVSTAQVAALTVPVDELADLVAGRLLSTAVLELSTPTGGVPEQNRSEINGFFAAAGIQTAIARQAPPVEDPEPVVGAQNIAIALRDRAGSLTANLNGLAAKLQADLPTVLERFDPRSAAEAMLLTLQDPFRTQRVLFGHPELPSEAERNGAFGVLQRLSLEPPPPSGLSTNPPPIPHMRDKIYRKVRWADTEPVAARERQDDWYRWRTRSLWAKEWDRQRPRWFRAMEDLQVRWRRFTDALLGHARQDADLFRERSDELTRSRRGVSYFLPLGGNDMSQFYERVVSTMIERRAQEGRLRPAASSTELLVSLVSAEHWRTAYNLAADNQGTRAAAVLREYVKEDVRQFLQTPGPNGASPLLPPMATRLRAAAGAPGSLRVEVTDTDVRDFRSKLAGLVPAGFAPQGGGPMKILITYPSDARNELIEKYLNDSLNLPIQPEVTTEYRPIRTESLSVVMFRYGMGVTEVDEVRDVLRAWAGALESESESDYLKWRQRTGYDYGYLATREGHRVAILHRLLCALWNGRIDVEGDEVSPRSIQVTLDGGIRMLLSVKGMDEASSWANIVRAYEAGALQDDRPLRRTFCERLMNETIAAETGQSPTPSSLYLRLVDMAATEIAKIESMLDSLPEAAKPRAARMLQFWKQTLPAARQFSFRHSEATAHNLAALEERYLERVGARS